MTPQVVVLVTFVIAASSMVALLVFWAREEAQMRAQAKKLRELEDEFRKSLHGK